MQVGAYVDIRLDKEAIRALQLGIDAYTVRAAIVASKLKVKAPQVTCAPLPLSSPSATKPHHNQPAAQLSSFLSSPHLGSLRNRSS